MSDPKPLYFTSDPTIGFTAERRPDGGMNLTFKDINPDTLNHWREFSEDERAIQIAVELNSDPSTRHIRLAVVVKDDAIRKMVQKISDQTPVGGARIEIFTDREEAEGWLMRPIESLI